MNAQISMTIDIDIAMKLKNLAESKNKTVSKLMNEILIEYFEREKKA